MKKIIIFLISLLALSCTKADESYSILLVGDPQVQSKESVAALMEDVLSETIAYNPAFAITLGDLADNSLDVYEDVMPLYKAIPYKTYQVFGNHDLNKYSQDVIDPTDKFKEWVGEPYQTFRHGEVSFVLLNNIEYLGWNTKENKPGDYFGGISDEQFIWLEEVLKEIPKSDLLVICAHIPFLKDYMNEEDIKRLFKMVEDRENIVSFTGHLHNIENYYFDKSTHWHGKAPFQNITVGAACGSHWSGPMDERGLPASTCTDGAPNGFYEVTFTGNEYKYKFIATNHNENFQIRPYFDRENLELYANVFTATEDATVVLWVDGKCIGNMALTRQKDPFIVETHSLRVNYDGWTPGIRECTHLWKLDLTSLDKGMHLIEIIASDDNGRYSYKVERLIEI